MVQKHTQFPGLGRAETNVVGVRVMPVFAVKSGAFFALITVGVLGLMGGLLTINLIWNLGPYKPSPRCRRAASPDFPMWTEGLARIWPAWEFYPFGTTTVPVGGLGRGSWAASSVCRHRLSLHRQNAGDR